MSQPGQPPTRLVQIESLKKEIAPTASEAPPIEIPAFSDVWVYTAKTRIALLKIGSLLFARHSYGVVRRWALSNFLPDRILYRWKPYQRGGCNRCGLCCKLTFRCPFYLENEETTACMIYTTKHAVPPCVVFPIDPIDLREVQREIGPAPCPFYFEGQPEHPTTWGAVKAELRLALGKRVDKLKEAFNF